MQHLILNRLKLKIKLQQIWIGFEKANKYEAVGKEFLWIKNNLPSAVTLPDWDDNDFITVKFYTDEQEDRNGYFQINETISKDSAFASLLWKQEFFHYYTTQCEDCFVKPQSFIGGIEVFRKKPSNGPEFHLYECLEFVYKTSREELILNSSSKLSSVEMSPRSIEINERFLNLDTKTCQKARENERNWGYAFAGQNPHTSPVRFEYSKKYHKLKDESKELTQNFKSDFFDGIEPNFIEVKSTDQFFANYGHKMVFGLGGKHVNAAKAMSQFGPFKKVNNASQIEFVFIFPNADVANTLYRYLKRGLKQFPGLQSYVGIPISIADQSLNYRSINNLSNELDQFIQSNFPEDNYTNKIGIVIGPFKKWDSDEKEEKLYYEIKYKLLEKGIPTQFINTEKIRDRNFHFMLPNISIAILAKLGGIPWKLDTPIQDELIIGFNASSRGNESFIGNAVLFDNQGRLNSVESFSPNDTKGIVTSLRRAIINYRNTHDQLSRIIIHYYKPASKKERGDIEEMLQSELGIDLPYAIIEVNDSRSKLDICFDAAYNFGMPKSGTYVKIGRNEYLLFNNVRYTDRPMSIYNQELPVKLRISYMSSEVFSKSELISQVYEFSRLNWKGLKQNSLPATITFSKLIAQFASGFDGDIPHTITAQKQPWFL